MKKNSNLIPITRKNRKSVNNALTANLTNEHAQRIHVAQIVARGSKAADFLDRALSSAKPRRKNEAGVTSVQFLFLLQLALARKNSGKATDMIAESNELPEKIKAEMGLPRELRISRVYKYTKELGAALDFSLARAPHLTDEQRSARKIQLDSYVTEFLSPTIYREEGDHKIYAIDSTAIHAPERGTKRPSIDATLYEDDEEFPDVNAPTPANPIVSISRRGSKGASDASWRGKTRTSSGGYGEKEYFHGYFANAIASAPIEDSGEADRSQIYSFTLTSAKADMFEASIRAVDQVHNHYGIEYLVGDRYYSNLKYDRWWTSMDNRRIKPVNDLTANQSGFADFDGVKIAAAWPHCPGTPAHLGDIKTLPPEPTNGERDAFNALITERKQYALTVINSFTQDSGRYSCPALSLKVGCALRGTELLDAANERGLTFVETPPTGPDLPRCCVDRSVTIRVSSQAQKTTFRNHQPEYWGSPKWQQLYRLRSSIERVFGYTKRTFRLDRNTYAFRGFGMSTVVLAALFAHVNARKLELWAENQDRDIDHPILKNPYLTQEQAVA